MKLRVLKDYGNSRLGLEYKAGEVIDVVESMGRFLLEAPGCFEVYNEDASAGSAQGKAPDAPAVDKAVKAPAAKKGRR